MSTAKAQKLYRDFLSKAGGEGSKGGKVIGHTSSGAPVYSHDHKTYNNLHAGKPLDVLPASRGYVSAKRAYPKFSEKDHNEASALHRQHGMSEKLTGAAAESNKRAQRAHFHAGNWDRAKETSSPGTYRVE